MILPLWIILAITTGLLSNFYNFLNRYLLKDNDDPTAFAWYTEFLRFIAFTFFALFSWKLILTPYSFLILLSVGISEFIAGYYYMKMHAFSHLSISTILSRTRLIWVPILGFFLLKEYLHLYDYVGILIIFVGVSTLMAPKKLLIDQGAKYANISALFIACNVVLLKMAVPYASTAVIVVFEALPSVILYPIFMKNAKTRITTLTRSRILLKSFTISISVVQIFIFVLALQYGEASKINAVYQGMLFISVLAGIIFLHERKDIAKKLIGAAITIIGVVILSL